MGRFRIIYRVAPRRLVELVAIGPRRTIYEETLRRLVPECEDEELMTNTDLCYTPAIDLVRMIRSKALSPVELTRAVLDRLERLNPRAELLLHGHGR